MLLCQRQNKPNKLYLSYLLTLFPPLVSGGWSQPLGPSGSSQQCLMLAKVLIVQFFGESMYQEPKK